MRTAMSEWYKSARQSIIQDCMVERIVRNALDPDLYDIYGVVMRNGGKFSDIGFLDYMQERDRKKVKLKSWLRQIHAYDIYLKYGDYFARRIEPTLSLTMVYNDSTDLWERLDIGPTPEENSE